MTVHAEQGRGIDVSAAGPDAASAWDAFVTENATSTVYHRFAWRRIFGETFGYPSWYLQARDESGALVGCLPLFLVSSPTAKRLVAVPFRDRGGVIWTIPEALSALLGKAKDIADEQRADYVEIKTVQPYPEALWREHGFTEHLYWMRSSIDLRTLTQDRFWKDIGAKTRNMIRQGETSGLTFADETGGTDSLSSWYSLFLETQKRNGVPPFPSRFFERMFEELRPVDAVRLFVVRRSAQPVAATIVFLHGRTAIYAYSASSRAGQSFRPNDFMLFNACKWLLDHGCQEFDLGSDAPSQESLLFFKKKWLATQAAIPFYTRGRYSAAESDSSNPRYRIARRAVQHLPDPVLRMLGNLTCRYFG